MQGIFATFTRVLEDMEPLSVSEAKLLRDIALNHESGAPVSREDAIQMLEIASRIIPEGAIIKKKLKEWKSGT